MLLLFARVKTIYKDSFIIKNKMNPKPNKIRRKKTPGNPGVFVMLIPFTSYQIDAEEISLPPASYAETETICGAFSIPFKLQESPFI